MIPAGFTPAEEIKKPIRISQVFRNPGFSAAKPGQGEPGGGAGRHPQGLCPRMIPAGFTPAEEIKKPIRNSLDVSASRLFL